MQLKDIDTLWGIPVVHLKEYSKKYRFWMSIVYLVDIALIFGLTAFMFYANVQYSVHGYVVVILALLVQFVAYFFLSLEKWEAFKFYKKHSKCNIYEKTYKISADQFYSILYCVGYKRLKEGKTIDDYKELCLSACCENVKYAKSIGKYLRKYEDDSGDIPCVVMHKGKAQYLIDFGELVKGEGNEDGNNDNSGDVEES